MKSDTKKNFCDILKYGKSCASVKKHVDILCDAVINELDGKYSVKYIAKLQLFIVNVDVPSWENLPVDVNKSKNYKDLFLTAHRFALQYLNFIEYVYWRTTNCQSPGKVEYQISSRKPVF